MKQQGCVWWGVLAAGAMALLVSIAVRAGSGPGSVLAAQEPAPATAPAAALTAVQQREQALWNHRNLGRAFYENPATQYEAVGELEEALALAPESARDRINYGLALLRAGQEEKGIAELQKAQAQDPSVPHTWFNLGIAYKRAARYPEARAQLERMVELAPEDPIAHYQLGVLLKLDGEELPAIEHFQRAAALDPSLAGPHFQLATAYRQAGRTEDGQREMTLFRQIKQRTADAAVPEDLEWSWYSELFVPAPDRRPVEMPAIELERSTVASELSGSGGLSLLDADGDERPDLLVWGDRGLALLAGGTQRLPIEPTVGAAAVEAAVRWATPGDFDNDGRADLAVIDGAGAVRLLRNTGAATARLFETLSPGLPAALAKGPYSSALWLDYDHDYDLDLVLLGRRSALARNNGDGTFTDHTDRFPFAAAAASYGTLIDTLSDTQGKDLLVNHRGRAVLYRDRLGGRYEAQQLGTLPPRGRPMAAEIDGDGWVDLLVEDPAGNAELWINDHRGGFTPAPLPAGVGAPLTVADLGNRGQLDLVAGGRLFPTRAGSGFGAALAGLSLPAATASTAADFDADGKVDLALLTAAGEVVLARNRSPRLGNWVRVSLEGVKNLKLAAGAEVELTAGTLYQKRIYQGTPLVLGLADEPSADAIRITWPNGLIQNETRRPAGSSELFREAARLSGSCPMIFTWNGREFEFITDVLGVAPLGAAAGDGEYFPVDHDEHVQIPGESLAVRDGQYEIHVTEELREVAFLDEIRLIALDRPAGVDLAVSDKFQGPPFPEHRLYGIAERRYPVAARDDDGRDVLDRLLARDGRYPDGFERDYAGVAELHALELDFGATADGGGGDSGPVLIASGWVDWADGSSFLAAAQAEGGGLILPYLQVQDEAGEWQTVIEDMGIPAGKPKTIAVDLTGRFLSQSRKVRIVSNLCAYWDEIFLTPSAAEPEVVRTELSPAVAELAFRGFSRPVIHPQRLQPERFVYADRRPLSMWNPTPGLYTRYGDVVPLLAGIDDRFVIMGSGDELRLRFDAEALPPLPAGWRRDFLLFVDGWAKDGDANTAFSQTVEPLPYHGMPQYPYAAPDRFPDSEEHRRWREEYNTRPALRLIAPLHRALRRPETGPEPVLGFEE